MEVSSGESWFTTSDGLEVYERTWLSEETPRAHIILLHGYSDRVDLYDQWCTSLVSSFPIRVTGYDRRGWGKTVHTPSQRGLTGPNEQVLSDLDEYIQHIASGIPDLKSTPLFLMGHSMGGQEVTYYSLNKSATLTKNRHLLSGLILDAPYIALCKPPSPLLVMASRAIALIAPKRQMNQRSDPSTISRDPAVCKAWAEDELCHDTGTIEGLKDTLLREAELTALADSKKPVPASLATKLPYPVLFSHGTADGAVSYSISKQLCDRLEPFNDEEENKQFDTYDGWFHALHSEPEKEQYANDVGTWVMKTTNRLTR